MHARLDRGAVRLLARTWLDWTHKYPAIAAAVAWLPARQAYLDGELCGVRPDGTTSFSLIQNASDTCNSGALAFSCSISSTSFRSRLASHSVPYTAPRPAHTSGDAIVASPGIREETELKCSKFIGWAPESQFRTGLAGGGKRIRTFGTAVNNAAVLILRNAGVRWMRLPDEPVIADGNIAEPGQP
ncbi:MAG TPA: hypothetical protein VGG86_17085, partial [Roseiarcus sp.]